MRNSFHHPDEKSNSVQKMQNKFLRFADPRLSPTRIEALELIAKLEGE